MAQAQDPLSDLFEHGSLPFVGRAHELRIIDDFWKSTFLAERLRALVITGEAGSGKSRLLEATLPSIAQQGGLVAHVKIYPDATAAIAPLILEGLRSSNLFHHVSRSGSGTPLSVAAQALRRIARLRPLLLVIEDIHLLEGETLKELNQLLDMLADEPISALFTTRPVQQRARGVVERHLVEEITLSGLGRDVIAELWESVIGEPASPELIEQLHRATLGNPLALRSALREALNEERGAGSSRESAAPVDRLRHLLEHRVGLLAEGMVAHLDESELRAATTLAVVGEVFAREAAAMMLESPHEMLEALQGKGIVSSLTTPALPLSDAVSSSPLYIFSHSLIHKHLIGRAATAPEDLLRLILAGKPLYSLLPFQLLLGTDAAALPRMNIAELRRLHEQIEPIIARMCDGSDWQQGMVVCELAEKLIDVAAPGLSEEERREVMLEQLHLRLNIFRRELSSSAAYERCITQFLELTANPANERQAKRRICALDNLMAFDDITTNLGKYVEFCWNDAEEVIERFPSVTISRRYILFLATISIYGRPTYNQGLRRAIAAKMAIIESSPDTTDETRRFAWRKLSPILLRDFSTHEELAAKLQLMRELDRETDIEDWLFLMEKLLLLEAVGEVDDLLTAADRWNSQLVARGLFRSARSCGFVKLRGLAMLGVPFEILTKDLQYRMMNPHPLSVAHRARFGRSLAQTALLCGDLTAARKLIVEFPECESIISPELRIALALESGEDASLAALLEPKKDDLPEGFDETTFFSAPDPEIALLIRALLDGENADRDVVSDAVKLIAEGQLLRTGDLLRVHSMLALIAALDARAHTLGAGSTLKPLLTKSLVAALDWAAERRMPPVVEMLMRNHGGLLAPRQRTLWNNRLAAIAEERRESLADGARPPLAVSVIGTISFSKENMEPHRIRGERMRVLLALMVANVLMAPPLGQEEFAAIATGIEDDPEGARLSLTHMIYRLRETIGASAVLTTAPGGASGATPQLNPAIVDVDLVRAWRALRVANDALLDGFLAKAARALIEAIDIVGSEIIFPTLYDSFFEALRTDFENRMRHLLLAVAERLLEEGDGEGAVTLLERSLAVMPDDGEIARRLREALTGLGRIEDAERVRV